MRTVLLSLALTLLPTPAAAQHFDILIRGGQVLDGSGSPAFTADVGINDDRIVAIGKLPDATATRVIDAAGKYVVPGFIDMHSHADRIFASDNVEGRRAHNLVMQGITTSVFGPDGRNPVWPIADEMDAYRAPGVATNVVPMVGHATVRGMVMGDGTDGMRETIEIGRATGIRVVGTHIKAKGTDTWGHSATDILLIEAARREGVQVYLDQYPYETFGGGPVDVIPDWGYAPPGTDRSGGLDAPLWRDAQLMSDPKGNLRANLADPVAARELERDTGYILRLQGGADRHIVVEAPDYPETVGRHLAEIASDAGRTPFEQLVHFALESTRLSPAGVRFRPVAGHRFDVENYMRQEYTATSTDGFVSLETRPGQHPRSYGAFTRKIAHYVKERGAITLPFAIRSSTGLPAQIVGLKDRGYVREGFKADIVVFDYDDITSPATIMEPDLYPDGIEYVMVNGRFTVDGGELTGALPGAVLDRRRRDAATRGVSQ